MKQEKIIAIAEQNGWHVHIAGSGNDGRVMLEFSRFTPYGQDFNFQAEMEGNDLQTLIGSIIRFWMVSTPTAKHTFGWGRTGTERTAHPIV